MSILPGGWVVVGSLPTTDGNASDGEGRVPDRRQQPGASPPRPCPVTASTAPGTWRHSERGPTAALFVTNVLNGTVAAKGEGRHQGTVLRLVLKLRGSNPPVLVRRTVIGSGFGKRTDPAALVVGPTGVGLNSHGTLFVADSLGNRITAIPNAVFRRHSAGTGHVVTSGGMLNTPLGLIIAPNGDVLTVNGGDGLLVETTPAGMQIAHRLLDKSGSPPGAGALFGLALKPHQRGIYYVDDAVNTLRLFH